MPLRQIIMHNFWLKLVSLGLASLIWLGVRYQIQSDYGVNQPRSSRPVFRKTVKVRVSTIIKPGDGRAYRVSPSDVMVVLLAEESVLSRVFPTDVMVYVDLTDFNPRKPTMELHSHARSDVIIGDIQPANVTVEQISP